MSRMWLSACRSGGGSRGTDAFTQILLNLGTKTMSKHVKSKKEILHALVGSWTNGDEYETNVEYIVGRVGHAFTVRAIDRFDNEEGVVYDVVYDAKMSSLSFNVRWPSTGRFINARLVAISRNRVSYTYTYTETQMWFRNGTEPAPARKPSRTIRRSPLKKNTI